MEPLPIRPYMEMLREQADNLNVDLKEAFHAAGINDGSTSRYLRGERNLTFPTADKVATALYNLALKRNADAEL